MPIDKPLVEIKKRIGALDNKILSGQLLSYEDYKARCAERKAYLDSIQIINDATHDEDDS